MAKDLQEAHNLAHDQAKNQELVGLQAAMKARVLQLRVPNASTPRPYDNAPVPAVTRAPGGTQGLAWSMFEGEWPWLPDFRTLTPVQRGATKTVDLAMAVGSQPFGVAFEGYFYATQAGEYTFTLVSDTGAMLFLHDIRVIGEPMKNAAGKFTGNVRLRGGWHPMRLYYRHAGSAKPRLELTCQQGGMGEYQLSPEVFRPVGDKV